VSGPFSLIVTDTSPLLTLVFADALDIRCGPVCRSASLTPSISKRPASAAHRERTRSSIGSTRISTRSGLSRPIGVDQQRRLEDGRSIRALGEQAAIETLDRFLRSDTGAEALLLFEDSDVSRRRAIIEEHVSLMSTGDFLGELEAAGLIQSADFILDEAAARGRNVERQRQAGEDAEAAARLRAQLEGRRGGGTA
jgi:hypothetical protein